MLNLIKSTIKKYNLTICEFNALFWYRLYKCMYIVYNICALEYIYIIRNIYIEPTLRSKSDSESEYLLGFA